MRALKDVWMKKEANSGEESKEGEAKAGIEA